jgi:hypothetical protein
MKKLILIAIFGLSVCQAILPKDTSIKQQDVSPKQLQKQNKQIVQLAAQELSKTLPQKINKYTTITDIKADGTTLIYLYEVNTGSKSDQAIIKEDRTRWEKLFVENVCKRSKRFLDAQVHLSYRYISAKTKVKLFQFDVTQAKCFKRFGRR